MNKSMSELRAAFAASRDAAKTAEPVPVEQPAEPVEAPPQPAEPVEQSAPTSDVMCTPAEAVRRVEFAKDARAAMMAGPTTTTTTTAAPSRGRKRAPVEAAAAGEDTVQSVIELSARLREAQAELDAARVKVAGLLADIKAAVA